jgi:ADP-ribosylglycohydrolase
MTITDDYAARVYAGVLGKIIGVYLGRPIEGWENHRIIEELGEIHGYVNQRLSKPLVVPDDDITGTFTFVRAVEDYGPTVSPEQIGKSWLNYIIEDKTILWWGGMGVSTEHTAFLRLKNGVAAPQSGSIKSNGKVVAEQIGAQIFIDGWGMVCPGEPKLAADFAKRAASVSHDGEAVYAAQVIAAIESMSFVEKDLKKILDTVLLIIPRDCLVAKMIADLRYWRASEQDWRKARQKLASQYGYDKFGGGCHVIPNHGVVILSLLYGNDNFSQTLSIAASCGWDTDCNAGNVGCLMGIKNGLADIDKDYDWRGPVADRLYLPSADGGRCFTDALTEAVHIVNIGRRLALQAPIAPKKGAIYNFGLPGAVQGFVGENLKIENVAGHSTAGKRALAIHHTGRTAARATVATFDSPEVISGPYAMVSCPTIYPGQRIHAAIACDAQNPSPTSIRFFVASYDENDEPVRVYGPETPLLGDQQYELAWRVPETPQPIFQAGIEFAPSPGGGTAYLDYFTWDGDAEALFRKSPGSGSMWRRAWTCGCSVYDNMWSPLDHRIIQNQGRGVLIQGTRRWKDYFVEATVQVHLARAAGVAVRVQGLTRYYAMLLTPAGKAKLVKNFDAEIVLAEVDFPMEYDRPYKLKLQVYGDHLTGWIDDQQVFELSDHHKTLHDGAIALVCQEGRIDAGPVRVRAVG